VSAFETKTDLTRFAEVDESITWDMEFPSGTLAACTTTYNAGGINHFRAYCERGSFWMSPAYSYEGLRAGSTQGPIEFQHRDHFGVEMDDFAKCILEDRESKVAGVEGLRDMVIVEAIYESIRKGAPVGLG
jgi:predicted dehydrogenase